ncbi:VWA domain-containing protein [bacterium]|nr:VWA domain-containing protein [bacterium]
MVVFSLAVSQEYEVSVTTITVWVKAIDKNGRPVQGLTAEDFEVYEDGKKITTTCFDEIGGFENSAAAAASTSNQESTETAALMEPSRRRLVLFVDLFNTSMAEYQRVKNMTEDFLNKVDPKVWDLMLGAMINTGRAGVIVPFGHSIKNVSQQLPLLKPNAQRDFTVINRKRQIAELLKTDPTQIEQAYRLANGFARLEKIDSEKSIQSFVQLAEFLQKEVADEHVVVVYISGGINLQPGRVYYDIVNNIAGLGTSNQDYTEFALRLPESIKEPNFDIDRKITQSIGVLNKQNITVYCMNARGSANPADDNIHEQDRAYIVNDPSFLKDYQESLDQIADETGGISFRNSNNLAKGFTDILQDSDHQYIICYKPPDHKDKGKYHNIKVVSLKSEINLRFRKGYVD